MAISAFPEKVGLVESLARPGGNVTGLTNIAPELAGKRLEFLKEIAPKISRVAFLFNPGNAPESFGLSEGTIAAQRLGVQIEPIEVRTLDDYPKAFRAVIASGADTLRLCR